MNQENGCKCQSCGIYYIGDLIVPDDIWERIKPKGKGYGAGMLCPTCILHRVVEAKIWSAAAACDIEALDRMVDQ